MKLGNIVKKMRLDNNSLVLIKTGSALATIEALTGLQKVISQTDMSNVVLVVADDLSDALIVHEQELNKLGWYHIKALAKTIKQDRPVEKEEPHE